jgi:MFS family permease
MLLDRFGTRRMVVTGSLLMAGGQLLFATTTDLGAALAARVAIGAGDAMIFVSVLRLVALWFPARRAPLVQQLTGIIGQAGAIVAAVPLVGLLGLAGWTATFAGPAGLGVFAAAMVLALVRDARRTGSCLRPPGSPRCARRPGPRGGRPGGTRSTGPDWCSRSSRSVGYWTRSPRRVPRTTGPRSGPRSRCSTWSGRSARPWCGGTGGGPGARWRGTTRRRSRRCGPGRSCR